MGYDPFQPGAAQSVLVSIEKQGDGLAGRAVYLDATGGQVDQRDFKVPDTSCSCWALVTDLAVSIAFTLDPFRLPEAPRAGPECPAPRSQPRPSAHPPSPRPAPPGPAPKVPRGSRPALQAGVGGLLGVGLADQPTGGVFGGVRVRWASLSIGIEGLAHLPAPAEGELGASARVGLIAGAVLPCAHQGIFFGCAVGELGWLRLRGDAVSADHPAAPFLGIGGRGGVEIPLGARFLVQARAELLGTFAPRFLPINDNDGWRTSPLTGTFATGLAATF